MTMRLCYLEKGDRFIMTGMEYEIVSTEKEIKFRRWNENKGCSTGLFHCYGKKCQMKVELIEQKKAA